MLEPHLLELSPQIISFLRCLEQFIRILEFSVQQLFLECVSLRYHPRKLSPRSVLSLFLFSTPICLGFAGFLYNLHHLLFLHAVSKVPLGHCRCCFLWCHSTSRFALLLESVSRFHDFIQLALESTKLRYQSLLLLRFILQLGDIYSWLNLPTGLKILVLGFMIELKSCRKLNILVLIIWEFCLDYHIDMFIIKAFKYILIYF